MSPSFIPYSKQIARLLQLSQEKVSSNSVLVVWPESAICQGIDEKVVYNCPLLFPIFQFLEQYPQLHLITGIHCYRSYGSSRVTTSAQLRQGEFVDVFNSIFHFKWD